MSDRPEPASSPSSSPVKGPTVVLFVEDEQHGLARAATELRRVDESAYEVRTTTDPGDAVELVAAGAVDCLVCGHDLPELDAFDLLHRARARDPHVPFIVVADGDGDDLAQRAVDEGATDLLHLDRSAGRVALLANRIDNAVERYRLREDEDSAEPAERGGSEALAGSGGSEAPGSGGSEAPGPGGSRAGLLSDIADNISESVFVATEDEALYVSDAIEDIYGLPKETLVDEPLAFLVHVPADDRDRVEAWYEEWTDSDAVTDREESEIEFRYDHPEKGRRHVNVDLTPIFDDQGEYDRHVGIASDVTEKREAVAELRRNEAKFRSIAETSNDLIFRIDGVGDVSYASPSLRDILGYAPADVEGDSFIEYIEEGDEERAFESFTETMAGTLQNDLVLALEHADGHEVPTEVNTVPIRDGDEIVGVQGVARDISDRRERERELEQYETIVQTVPDGVFVLDELGRVVNANERAARIVGLEDRAFDFPSDPIPELTDDGIGSDAAIEKYDEAVRELVSSGEDRTMYRLRASVDGEPRGFEIHMALRPRDDEFSGTIGVIRDVTERLAYERELERQNDRLEQFASTISHDLRNPLSVATGHLDEHMNHCDDELLEPVAAAHDRIDGLIDDILMLARHGQPLGERSTVSLADVARNAWETVDTADASLSVDDGLGTVRADESRLRQLLENLFRNSVEHAGADTAVTVGPLLDRAGFYVSDDGPGIPPDERDRVFDQGYCSGDSTGFGLAIVREIVDAHDWAVSVVESEDGGAHFEIAVDPAQEFGDDIDATS